MIPFIMVLRSEYWCYTFFPQQDGNVEGAVQPLTVTGSIEHVYQLERCPTTLRIHFQGFIHYSKAVSRSFLLKHLSCKSLHLEVCRDPDAARAYCRKSRTRA